MPSITPSPCLRFGFAALLVALGSFPRAAHGQALSGGSLSGTIVDDRGMVVAEAALTLSRDGVVIRILLSDLEGRFRADDLAPGRYDVLAEQVGYQPVRTRAVPVVAGERLEISIEVPRRPPPITEVIERGYQGAGAVPAGSAILGAELEMLARRPDATDLADAFSAAMQVGDLREQGILSVNGLPPRQSRLVIDGIEAVLLRHPGLPIESATSPSLARDGMDQVRLSPFVLDAAQPAAPGGLLELVSRSGSPRTAFSPHVSWSGSTLGVPAEANPADSSAGSFIAGLAASGPIKGDTAGWAVRFDFRQLATPGGSPFSSDEIGPAIDVAAGTRNVTGWTAPAMPPWQGGKGAGAMRIALGRNGRLSARAALATWDEDNPVVGDGLSNGSGVTLAASDVSAGVNAEFWGREWRSITRLGIEEVSREWTAVGVPYTTLANDGAAIGVQPAVPGEFAERLLSIGQVLVAPTGNHELSAGATLGLRRVTYDWLPYGFGAAAYGGVDEFATGTGSWVSATASDAAPELSVTEIAVFLQDDWQASRRLRLQFGLRLESNALPSDAVSPDADVAAAFGIVNDLVPTDRSSGVAPRLGFRWDPSGRGRTMVHGAAGLVPGRYDLVALAEAARHDGAVEVARATGAIGWPGEPADPLLGKAITFFDDDVRAPRAIHVTGGVSHAVAAGTVLSVTGGFQHTDYLLRREDVNLPTAPLAHTSEGRPVWGDLTQFGGLLVPAAGSNRRVVGFDRVWGLASTGYAEQQYASVSLEHRGNRGLTLAASYTWSRTEDNLPGQLSADPADRVLRLDDTDPAATWSDGRSDLDVPHRVAVSAHYRAPGAPGVTLSARWRWRSGLPFTPGFAPGVDVNGDGSAANDPVSLRGVDGITGLLGAAGCDVGNGAFAERNACRSDAVQGLDLGAGVRLPIGGSRQVVLSVEAFNLVASAVGIVDRAAVLVDPDGTVTTDGDGRLVLPLVTNDHFGQLLSRRTAPRTIRFGLRVEH